MVVAEDLYTAFYWDGLIVHCYAAGAYEGSGVDSMNHDFAFGQIRLYFPVLFPRLGHFKFSFCFLDNVGVSQTSPAMFWEIRDYDVDHVVSKPGDDGVRVLWCGDVIHIH